MLVNFICSLGAYLPIIFNPYKVKLIDVQDEPDHTPVSPYPTLPPISPKVYIDRTRHLHTSNRRKKTERIWHKPLPPKPDLLPLTISKGDREFFKKWSQNSEISHKWFDSIFTPTQIVFWKTSGDPTISARTLERSQFLEKYPGQIQRHFVAMKNDENKREIAEEKILVEPEEESIVRVITGNIVRTLLEDSNMQQDRIQKF